MKEDDEGFAKKNCNDIFQPFTFDWTNWNCNVNDGMMVSLTLDDTIGGIIDTRRNTDGVEEVIQGCCLVETNPFSFSRGEDNTAAFYSQTSSLVLSPQLKLSLLSHTL